MEITDKIHQCDTIPKLDSIRLEVITNMMLNKGENFTKIQNEFIKQKNKLKRIPLNKRTW